MAGTVGSLRGAGHQQFPEVLPTSIVEWVDSGLEGAHVYVRACGELRSSNRKVSNWQVGCVLAARERPNGHKRQGHQDVQFHP